MFSKKKVNYIFASFGDEKIIKSDKKSFFLKRFMKKEEKNDSPIQNKNVFELFGLLISQIQKFTDKKNYSFYLNMENTHDQFINDIQNSDAEQFYIFPLFPQTHPDINSIANFFSLNLYDEITNNFFWVKSFHNNQFFIKAIQKNIYPLIKKETLNEKETLFLFLANDYPNSPLYNFECEITCQNIIKAFQYIDGKICFFNDNNQNCLNNINRKNVILIPISTLIDDVDTQKNTEVIKKELEKQKKAVFICKTLNHNTYFIRSIVDIIEEKSFVSNKMLSSC